MSELAIPQVEAFLTPNAFAGLHEKGLVVTPNNDHIARIGEIIGNEMPERALPAEVEELAIIIRGRTSKTDQAPLTTSWDTQWLKADSSQLYIPSGELRRTSPSQANTATKATIAQAGKFVLEFTAARSGTWGKDRPERFIRQWTDRRALDSMAKNIPHELKGAFSDIPLLGSKARKQNRIVKAAEQEKLDPFFVMSRRDAIS